MSEQQAPADFGRVDPDGTVYVITGDTERSVGQIPDSTPEEAMAFYVRRYENLAAEVTLLESRVKAQAMSPEEARTAIETAKKNVAEANAVGDLPALTARLEAVSELLPAQIEARKAQRAEQNAVTVAAKEAMVVEAEQLAAGNDWRGGVDRFRTLLDEWKALPRIDRATDNELWHRFSSARTQYTRRRKAHFSELNSHRDDAKAAKEAIIAEAEPLATSTDWGATSAAFRDLMTRWKAAGSARRADDDKLWARFRGIQDEFFNARSEAQNAADGEQSENLAAKQALVEKVEKDLEGVTDIEAAKSIHRDFLAQFNEIGHVPRNAMRDMDNRVRTLGEKVSELEAEEWRRTDPEARERAESTVKMFEDQIAKLEQDLARAKERGDDKKAKDAQKSIETYTSWLEQARETLADFTK
ncbi:DUF349 domain-containing protein [Tessaracoccus sp. MC1865]|uniref:DUF349 domain-containing protein n=1 Tax=Tessaracoccus sp. MC1865 TaxID=2760310 RepID=UPI0016001348|nr:DUF349 domain-containing protein [Tessaracoccus sp. MC1865]MBB1484724.1 DUF349 domain-containing protein [Tessaracoccus sp. MC1865]QTO36333.1 DUF349 domain-containing protein [Tessaracoccus sp. MC1865]